jgi:hypothetical protein
VLGPYGHHAPFNRLIVRYAVNATWVSTDAVVVPDNWSTVKQKSTGRSSNESVMSLLRDLLIFIIHFHPRMKSPGGGGLRES